MLHALTMCNASPSVVTTVPLEVPMSAMDRWFVPLLQQIDCEETKTKTVRRFVMSSLAQLSRLVDPGCHSAQVAGDDEEKTHASYAPRRGQQSCATAIDVKP